MRLQVLDYAIGLIDCRTRLPFRFGISTLTYAPLCTLRVNVELEDGSRGTGYSSDLLVPKWFEKDAAKSARDDVESLLGSVRSAGDLLVGTAPPPATAFDHWWTMYTELVGAADEDAPDRLVRGFGPALCERALIDAACRVANRPFTAALHEDLLGFDPGRAFDELRTWTPEHSMASPPLQRLHVRHTIGMLDALRERDVPGESRRNDGWPESLESDIERGGLTHFKIKLGGTPEQDLPRLLDIAAVLESCVATTPRCTIDGNEQFDDLAALADLLDELATHPRGRGLLDGLIAIEQPLPRARTFDSAPNAEIRRVDAYAPLLIDEADAALDAFPRARRLGYRGVSAKNCKGVFRALINLGLCAVDRNTCFLSAEDLTTLPAIALQQDLATVAALGLTHVERNGHHFFRGLDHLPPSEAESALAAHPDLYERVGDGIGLRVTDGCVDIASLHGPGFGHAVDVAFDERTPAEDWNWPEDA